MTFGEKVADARAKKGISQSELARRVGVSQKMISVMEDGFKAPGLALAKEIALQLDVSLDYLVGLEKK